MKIIGTVRHGIIELPADSHLPEGQRVEITLAPARPDDEIGVGEAAPSYTVASDLPDDLAINHDYYLHGQRKQEPRRGRWIHPGAGERAMTEREAADLTMNLLDLAAQTRNLPPDLSTNHDHYLHGLPKR